jgi:hypothetical protein
MARKTALSLVVALLLSLSGAGVATTSAAAAGVVRHPPVCC